MYLIVVLSSRQSIAQSLGSASLPSLGGSLVSASLSSTSSFACLSCLPSSLGSLVGCHGCIAILELGLRLGGLLPCLDGGLLGNLQQKTNLVMILAVFTRENVLENVRSSSQDARKRCKEEST